ncbi:MAG: hypothetical protein ACRBB4_00055 [Neptuniibacter sp.]
MTAKVIEKPLTDFICKPNMIDYDTADSTVPQCQTDGLPDGGVNICYEAVDRHLNHGLGNKTAIL